MTTSPIPSLQTYKLERVESWMHLHNHFQLITFIKRRKILQTVSSDIVVAQSAFNSLRRPSLLLLAFSFIETRKRPPSLSHFHLLDWRAKFAALDHQWQTPTIFLLFHNLSLFLWWCADCALASTHLDEKGIPKHSSLGWLMLLKRSLTRDRLISSGLQSDPHCLLCIRADESRNHIYFLRPFSSTVWHHFTSLPSIASQSNSWEDVTHSLLSLTTSRDHKYLTFLSWQAVVYELWWERNERLHRGRQRSPTLLCSKIKRLIKNRISSFRPESNTLASRRLQLWFSLSPPSG